MALQPRMVLKDLGVLEVLLVLLSLNPLVARAVLLHH